MVVPIIQCQSSVKTHQSLVCPPIWLCLCFCPPRYTKWIWRLWCLRLLCGGGGIEDAMVWESSQLYIYLHMQINWVWKSVSNFYHEGKIKILIGLTDFTASVLYGVQNLKYLIIIWELIWELNLSQEICQELDFFQNTTSFIIQTNFLVQQLLFTNRTCHGRAFLPWIVL